MAVEGGMKNALLPSNGPDAESLEEHHGHGNHGHGHGEEPPSSKLQLGVVLIIFGVIVTTAGSTFLLSQLRAREKVDNFVVMMGSTLESSKHIGMAFCLQALERGLSKNSEVEFKSMFSGPQPLYEGFFKDRHNASSSEVDVIIGAEMPVNHALWLEDSKNYRILGTLSENVQVSWTLPTYMGINSLVKYAQYINTAPTAAKVYYDEDCQTCPMAFLTTKSHTGLFPVPPKTLELIKATPAQIAAKFANQEQFALLFAEPSYMNVEFKNNLTFLIDSTNFSAYTQRNVNKIIIHKDTFHSLQYYLPKALEILSACFLGTEVIAEINAQMALHGMTVEAAVEEWIHDNDFYFQSMIRNVEDDESGGGHH